MAADEIMRSLQREQQEHDKLYHREIFYLPYPSRMRHLVLHFAKYAGRISGSSVDDKDEVFRRTLADTFIVALSAADMLNMKLFALLAPARRAPLPGLSDLGSLLMGGGAATEPSNVDWLFRRLAEEGGKMAKACESLDHMEAFDYRGTLTGSTLEIIRCCLISAHLSGLDLESLTRRRWKEIEEKFLS